MDHPQLTYCNHNRTTGHPLVAVKAIFPGVLMSNVAIQDLRHTNPGITRIINEELWLIVSVTATRLFVYRSVWLPTTDEWYLPVLELIGDAEPLVQVTIPDPGMMFGHAEHSIYPMREGWWEA